MEGQGVGTEFCVRVEKGFSLSHAVAKTALKHGGD